MLDRKHLNSTMKTILTLVIFLIPFYSFAQKISGTVTDQDGNVMPFATILVKNTTIGVTTNADGKYVLNLHPGIYKIECRYVGYTTTEKPVQLSTENVQLDFVLKEQRLELKEVVVSRNGEDPAYEIIRNAIKKRSFYDNQVKAFTADVYIKGTINMLHLPDKIFGKEIPQEDRKDMALDSSGQGIIYLSESLSHVSVELPDKMKTEVKSSRLSGANGYGFDFPVFISFYKNNVNLFTGPLNPRGFISPIADGALNFYNYKFLGSFFEDGKEVNTIRVTPKRKYEPLFTGIINITEDDWRIFSCKLYVTKESQLQLIDTVQIAQIHTPVEKNVWRVKNQVIHFHINQFGVAVEGNFVNNYLKYDLSPNFPKGFFDNTIMIYDSTANKKPVEYWDSVRPIPLKPEEIKDYRIKDSIRIVRDSTNANDSTSRRQNGLSFSNWIYSGVYFSTYKNKVSTRVSFEPLIKMLSYNTVEGVAINPSMVISRYSKALKTNVSFIADVRYGFHNKHLNPWGGFVFNNYLNGSRRQFNYSTIYVAGGKRISQFFKESHVSELINSISILLYGRNRMKIYENNFFKTGYGKTTESGNTFQIEGEYEDRIPLDNTTDFTFNKKFKDRITPNYPTELLDQQFERHQAVVLHASFRFQPGQRYIQYPNYKVSLGSKKPVFTIHYFKGIPEIFGSDVNFDKWQLDIKDQLDIKLGGQIRYFAGLGGFLNSKKVYVQDYKHYYGNTSEIAGEYLKSFQNLGYYQLSNKASFYTELHIEHHAQGLLTNKIPLFKKFNWFLVDGANALFINPETTHFEVFAGIENIFKIFRFDVIASLQNGYKPVYSYRIGFGGLLGDSINAIRFKRNQKIIGPW